MDMKKYFLALITIGGLLLVNNLQAQGYKISFKVDGLADTTVLLGNYFGESTYVKDTAIVDGTGKFTFDGKKKLDEGMYFLVLNKTRLFDFLVSNDQEFELQTSSDDYISNLKVIGDEENTLYIKDILFNVERNKEAEPFVKVVRDSTSTPEQIEVARKALDAINDKVMAHQNEIIAAHPDKLLTRIFLANKRADIPEAKEGVDSKEFGYWYLRNHYWDNFDLADGAFLRLGRPIFKDKVEDYLDNMLIQDPDTIMSEIKKMANAAKKNQDAYKYLVWTVTLKYQNPTIMGLDEVFVDLYDVYFKSGEMDFWANDQLKKNLKERADQLRLSLVGNPAPNMIMMDQNKQMKSLYGIKNKYTVIYFFDPDCGHCKKETPVLNSFYQDTKFDVEVFAVSADTSMVKMQKYIKDMNLNWISVNGPRTSTGSYHNSYDAMTTPTIYVLNDKKKIIAKKIPAAKLEDFLTQYEKVQLTKVSNQ
jgi:thiol-disulfide isomerase/thioredoxin